MTVRSNAYPTLRLILILLLLRGASPLYGIQAELDWNGKTECDPCTRVHGNEAVTGSLPDWEERRGRERLHTKQILTKLVSFPLLRLRSFSHIHDAHNEALSLPVCGSSLQYHQKPRRASPRPLGG